MSNLRPISLHNGHPSLRLPRHQVAALLRLLDRWPDHAIPPGELSVAFLTDPLLADLHLRFLADPSPTDVITFPGSPDEDFAGEICLSIDTAARSASARGLSLASEISLYLIHGWLHLAGLSDLHPRDRATMRSAESAALAWLQTHSPLPPFALAGAPPSSP